MKFAEQLKYFFAGGAAICLIAQNMNSFDCYEVATICLLCMIICWEILYKSK